MVLEHYAASNLTKDIYVTNLRLSKIYEALNNPEKAFEHYKLYVELKKKVSNIQKSNALLYYQTLYETEKRDLKIVSQESEISLLDEKNKIKTQWLLFGGFGLIAVFVIIILIRSRNNTRIREKSQQKFAQDLIQAQEEERTRLAREIHDSVGQKLMLLTKKTKSFEDENISSLAENTLAELRAISKGLHPSIIDKLGLSKAIESLVDEVDTNSDIFFTNEIDNIDDYLSIENSLHLYRLIQESLNNIVKHSKAKSATVNLIKEGSNIKVEVADNGIGFDVEKATKTSASLGMKTFIERAQILNSIINIQSTPNIGTTINLLIPINYDQQKRSNHSNSRRSSNSTKRFA